MTQCHNSMTNEFNLIYIVNHTRQITNFIFLNYHSFTLDNRVSIEYKNQ